MSISMRANRANIPDARPPDATYEGNDDDELYLRVI